VLVMAGSAGGQQELLVTGKRITLPPLGTQQDVGSMPMNMVLSPDGKYAIVSDMGFHQALYVVSTATGAVVSKVDFPNERPAASSNGLYYGLAFAPDGTLYAAQGAHDAIAKLRLAPDGTLTLTGAIATRKHDFPSGIATDERGTLYVANNDPGTFAAPGSVAVYKDGAEAGRYTFSTSISGTPNFPLAIAALKGGSKVYVASQRDSAVYVLDTREAARPELRGTIATGSHPVALLLNAAQSLLYVANADSDTVSVISTAEDRVVETLLVRSGHLAKIAGSSPVGLGLAPDGKTLYIALGDMNALAVAAVKGKSLELKGYIPTGWYPSAVAVSPDGKHLLFTNAKGTVTRHPNPGYKQWSFDSNPDYGLNLIRGSVSFVPVPEKEELERYTQMVLANNGLNEAASGTRRWPQDHALDEIGLKAGKIKHVIYIVKENRSYDQVLGDLGEGNGDPALVLFGKAVTPNQHALAQRFVLLDNFYVAGEASGDGWPWSTGSMANEYVIKNLPYNYSGRGRNYDFEGQNNSYLTGGHPAKDPDGNTMSVEFPNGAPAVPDVAEAPGGHIWDAVRAAGLSYRNYGFFYSFGEKGRKGPIIPDNYPSAAGLQPAGRSLEGVSDFDFRRFDGDYADGDAPGKNGCPCKEATYGHFEMPSRFAEWQREFQLMLAKDPTGNAVPAFMTIRFMKDHTEGFAPGQFAPGAQVADNDYAVGQLVEAISRSPIWESTAIFVVEDDAQDGPDHVDSHRSIAFVISPWIRAHTVDHTFYNTDSVLKTMEMLLGIAPLTQYDAIARPIGGWAKSPENHAPYAAILPEREVVCRQTPKASALAASDPMRELVLRSAKMDFVHPDSAPAAELNKILWEGIKGAKTPMPKVRNGLVKENDD
jgi:YVTN family beta-propeller protein